MNKITELASLNKTAAILVDEFAKRERHRGRSDLRKMFKQLEDKHKNKINKDDFMEVFHKLQAMGLGSIIVGRGVNPTRFVWNYNLKDIGLAAKGKIESNQIQSLTPSGGTYSPKGASSIAQKDHARQAIPVTSPGQGVEVLVISPKTGNLQRFKVPGDREELVLKLLTEFGTPA